MGFSVSDSQLEYILTEASYDHVFYGGSDGTTELARIHGDGNVDIANGNLKIVTAGKGIDFSATSDAGGMTSELLDDYEEGTWTPAATGASTAGTGVTGAGRYTSNWLMSVMLKLPVYYTTNNTRIRKAVKKTQSQLAAERDHEKFLKKMGIGSRSSVGIE